MSDPRRPLTARQAEAVLNVAHEEAVEATACRPVAADPGCYGCLGTGELKWAGFTEKHIPCMCTWHCAVHEAPLQVGEELCAVMEARSDA